MAFLKVCRVFRFLGFGASALGVSGFRRLGFRVWGLVSWGSGSSGFRRLGFRGLSYSGLRLGLLVVLGGFTSAAKLRLKGALLSADTAPEDTLSH